ncbi:MAG: YlxR family protein [Bacillales bacterium]|nr:YlxR family protein [Bacillales bacterium]
MKKIPLRTCVVTKEKLPKRELIRVVRTPDGEVVIDETGKLNGRGTYLKLDKDVILKAQKTKILDKNLEVEVKDNIYDELIKLIK